jgi:hypothetical protein
VENACIIYPLYTSETRDGPPYAPTPEFGYSFDGSRVRDLFVLMGQQNAILDHVAFPAQTAVIRVIVEDEWGRRTAAAFDIPVEALVYETPLVSANASKTRFYLVDRVSRVCHAVRSVVSAPYRLVTCSEACAIAPAERVFFCRQDDALVWGKGLCPVCFNLYTEEAPAGSPW